MSTPPTPPAISIQDRLNAAERLVRVFRFERAAYLVATVLSLSVLLAVAGRMFFRKTGSVTEWSLMLGSSGLITITTNRMLRMWSQALRLVASEPVDGRAAEPGNG